MLVRLLAASATLVLALYATLPTYATAQTPGEWRYTITTDQRMIPADMQVNFPTIIFSACRSAEDFTSGRAFALQTLASSAERCPSAGFVRTQPSPGSAPGQGDALTFAFACDAGQTLSGLATGRVQTTRFTVNLESRYSPSVGGVDVVRQTMSAARIGPCKVRPDSDLLKVK